MADAQTQAREAVQLVVLQNEKEELERVLRERDRRISQLGKSNEQLAEQVQQLKRLVKDAHKRYEDELQQTVASLQDQYNSALEMMQLGAGLGSHLALRGGLRPFEGAFLGSSGRAAEWRPGSQQPQPPSQEHQPRHACTKAGYKCSRAKASTTATASAARADNTSSSKETLGLAATSKDPRASLLGLDPDDFCPAASYGATVGLVTEPVAVLRDVLNLDGAHDWDRALLRERPATAAVGVSGPFLAQAQFESRLRGAYRSMLLQLQHRYQLERERQEDVHKLQLQEQEERHTRDLLQLAARHDEDLAEAARRLDQEAAARRADVQRLEAQLGAAKAAAETGQSQVAAARANAEALQAQLQLLRTTHEAELQHISQGSIPLQQHEEVVRRLKAEWDLALQQRERDYGALLAELEGLRRQMSSSNSGGQEPCRSSGNSCGHGSTVSPLAPAAAEQASVAAAAAATAGGRCQNTNTDPGVAGTSSRTSQGGQRQHSTHTLPLHHPAGQPPPTPSAVGVRLSQRVLPNCDGASSRAADDDGMWGGRGRSGGGGGGTVVPGSPAGSGYSVALTLEENGSAVLEVLDDPDATPNSRAYPLPVQGADLPRPSSASSSRLSELVDALVYGTSGRDGLTVTTDANQDNKGSNGRDNHGEAPQRSGSDPADEPLRFATAVTGGGEAGGGRGSCGGGSFVSWLAADWGPDGADQRPASSEGQPSSEVTFDRWQAPDTGAAETGPFRTAGATGRNSSRGGSGDDRSQGQGMARQGSLSLARGAGPAFGQQQQQQPRAVAAPGGGTEVPSTALRRGAWETSPPTSPLRGGPRQEGGGTSAAVISSWGGGLRAGCSADGSGVQGPRCLRCGLNDATSPGCCRFHPALLAQPGALRFTPEWITCQVAGHNARTSGCFVRTEHFYEPTALVRQPAATGPAVTMRAVSAAAAAAVAEKGVGQMMQSSSGWGSSGRIPAAPASPIGCGGGGRVTGTSAGAAATAAGAVRDVGGSRHGGGVEAGMAAAGTATASAPASALPRGARPGSRRVSWEDTTVPVSPPRVGGHARGVVPGPGPQGLGGAALGRPPRARSPGRGAVVGGGGPAAGSLGAENSPSPKPRTRLPSPARR